MSAGDSHELREKAYVESEPGPRSAEQDLSMLPLTEVMAEVSPRGLGDIELVGDESVIFTGWSALQVPINIPEGLPHVTLDIEGETRGLGDSKTEVESDHAGDASKSDEETPAIVNGLGICSGLRKNGALVGCDNDHGDEGGSC